MTTRAGGNASSNSRQDIPACSGAPKGRLGRCLPDRYNAAVYTHTDNIDSRGRLAIARPVECTMNSLLNLPKVVS